MSQALHTPRFDVAVVGEIYVDHVLSGFESWPGPGEEVVTDHYTREIGGGAAATACGLARLGRRVNLFGLVGETDGPWFVRRFADFGVGLDALRQVDGKTGMTVSVSTALDRSFFTHIGVNGGLSALLTTPETMAALARARHVHFALPLARPVADLVLPALTAAGCTTSLDMGYQPVWLTDARNHPTLRAVGHLLPNEKEAAILSGRDDVDAYFGVARTLGLRAPMLKLGAAGAMSRADELDELVTVNPPAVAAVDTTGAGDAFDAGFIDALLDGGDAKERLRRACITGALSTRAAGALSALPDRDELRRTYEHTYGQNSGT
jgi:sugar/nucleoside kinase (ribokinase family)